MQIRVRWADNNVVRFEKQLMRLEREFPKVLPQEINKVGDRSKTQVIRALTAQTGLPRNTIVKAIGKPLNAKPGRLVYEMRTKGGDIRLKYFSPRESRKGVVAKPFGQSRLFPSAFMKGGAFPNRVSIKAFHGNVYRSFGRGFRRDGWFGTRLTIVKSGVFIPIEMTKGATASAFERTAGPLLQVRIDAVMRKLIK